MTTPHDPGTGKVDRPAVAADWALGLPIIFAWLALSQTGWVASAGPAGSLGLQAALGAAAAAVFFAARPAARRLARLLLPSHNNGDDSAP